ncbi:hypothetical protein OIU79_024564 [Salix purpurea]|uniref:Uncharacterized protein n=1 Tax=Salix purpurea TaxID=77065 RepID=A0A9Q0WCK4_SALPP|nr:hypothetical protein OIU79_024564 [Salix purpurea]
MHESVSSPQANVNKRKEKVEGDRDRMRHDRTSSKRKENLTKLPQMGNMHVTTSTGSGFKGSTSLVQKPMERNREPEPLDEDVLMDEGHVMVANGTKDEEMEGIETSVGVILLEEREVRKDNP